MNNPFQIFTSPIFGNVRAALIDGVAWFVGVDVGKALGYTRPDMALSRHVAKEDKKLSLVATFQSITSKKSGNRQMIIINESGLYSLVMASHAPQAQEFKRWVTAEVLPSIRKTGSYALLEQPALPLPTLPATLPVPAEVKPVKLKRPRRLPSKMAFAYVFDMSDDTVKIGHTGDIEDRKARVKRERGLDVRQEHHTPALPRDDARRIEKTMHKKYAQVKVKGEFFRADFEEVSEELDRLANVEIDLYEEEIIEADYQREKLLVELLNTRLDSPLKEEVFKETANLLLGRKMF